MGGPGALTHFSSLISSRAVSVYWGALFTTFSATKRFLLPGAAKSQGSPPQNSRGAPPRPPRSPPPGVPALTGGPSRATRWRSVPSPACEPRGSARGKGPRSEPGNTPLGRGPRGRGGLSPWNSGTPPRHPQKERGVPTFAIIPGVLLLALVGAQQRLGQRRQRRGGVWGHLSGGAGGPEGGGHTGWDPPVAGPPTPRSQRTPCLPPLPKIPSLWGLPSAPLPIPGPFGGLPHAGGGSQGGPTGGEEPGVVPGERWEVPEAPPGWGGGGQVRGILGHHPPKIEMTSRPPGPAGLKIALEGEGRGGEARNVPPPPPKGGSARVSPPHSG